MRERVREWSREAISWANALRIIGTKKQLPFSLFPVVMHLPVYCVKSSCHPLFLFLLTFRIKLNFSAWSSWTLKYINICIFIDVHRFKECSTLYEVEHRFNGFMKESRYPKWLMITASRVYHINFRWEVVSFLRICSSQYGRKKRHYNQEVTYFPL